MCVSAWMTIPVTTDYVCICMDVCACMVRASAPSFCFAERLALSKSCPLLLLLSQRGSVACCVWFSSVEQHPNMKSIIATEVERLVYRPNVAQRAQWVKSWQTWSVTVTNLGWQVYRLDRSVTNFGWLIYRQNQIHPQCVQQVKSWRTGWVINVEVRGHISGSNLVNGVGQLIYRANCGT